MTAKQAIKFASLLIASLTPCLPVVAESAAPSKVPKMVLPDKSRSPRNQQVKGAIRKAVELLGKELNRDASRFAPKSARPFVRGKPLTEVLGRVRENAQKSFKDCSQAGGCR